MKVVIAMDSFKGSMTSVEAGNAAKDGVFAAMPDAEVRVLPLADGGEGTMEALCEGLGGELVCVKVSDPLGRSIVATYAVLPGGNTAVIEMAQAAGLTLLAPEERNPYKTTTYGVGQMICDAIDRGCRDFIIGIGGSATNDGGIGMLEALGYRFFDENGLELPGGAQSLGRVHKISAVCVKKELWECTFHIACDVTNPLCGENGATNVYAGQKGLPQKDVAKIDAAMASYAQVAECFAKKPCKDIPGAGAAGGMGFALVCFLGGELIPGAELVMQATGLEEWLKDADIFLTGEGRMDAQTASGKAPMAAAQLVKKGNDRCSVWAFAGQVSPGAEKCIESNIDVLCVITPEGMDVVQAMATETAQENMRRAVQRMVTTWKKGK